MVTSLYHEVKILQYLLKNNVSQERVSYQLTHIINITKNTLIPEHQSKPEVVKVLQDEVVRIAEMLLGFIQRGGLDYRRALENCERMMKAVKLIADLIKHELKEII